MFPNELKEGHGLPVIFTLYHIKQVQCSVCITLYTCITSLMGTKIVLTRIAILGFIDFRLFFYFCIIYIYIKYTNKCRLLSVTEDKVRVRAQV